MLRTITGNVSVDLNVLILEYNKTENYFKNCFNTEAAQRKFGDILRDA